MEITVNAADNFAVLRYDGAAIAEPTTATGTAAGTGVVEANMAVRAHLFLHFWSD